MPGLLLARGPGQLERLPRNGGDPGVTVRLDNVMMRQPGEMDVVRQVARLHGNMEDAFFAESGHALMMLAISSKS